MFDDANEQNNKLPWLTLIFSCSALLAGCEDLSRHTVSPIIEDVGPVLTSVPATVNRPFERVVDHKATFQSQPTVPNSIVIGLDADITSAAGVAGESIRRGAILAIDKINASGGLLGRPVELVVRDHRGNPDRGKQNILEFAEMRDVLAVIGGIHTPVVIQELPLIHEAKIPFLVPWAAGTPVIENDYEPNYVFRVSVRDEYAGAFLLDRALKRGKQRVALLMERTTWGRSNEKAILQACKERGVEPVAVEWLNWGERDLSNQVNRIVSAEADVILLVCNCLEGASVIQEVAKLGHNRQPSIISHWGIATGSFYGLISEDLPKVDLSFLQTFSFLDDLRGPEQQFVLQSYLDRFEDVERPAEIKSPVGTAQAYEIVMMLAHAVREAGDLDSQKVVRSMEQLRNYSGLIRDYDRPFPPGHHDALTVDDFFLAEFDGDGTVRRVQP